MRPWNPGHLKALAQIIIQRYQLFERYISFDIFKVCNVENPNNLLPPRFVNMVRNFWDATAPRGVFWPRTLLSLSLYVVPSSPNIHPKLFLYSVFLWAVTWKLSGIGLMQPGVLVSMLSEYTEDLLVEE